MTALSDFPETEVELVVSLPYRVGLHVSYADDEEGEQDDELEMAALEACLKAVAEKNDGLVKEIALKSLSMQDKWPSWGNGVFNIEPLCKQASESVARVSSKDETKAYVKMVLEVASAVAQAYGEFGEEQEEPQGFFGKAMSRIVGGFGGSDDAAHPMNISAAEDSAISRISSALKTSL